MLLLEKPYKGTNVCIQISLNLNRYQPTLVWRRLSAFLLNVDFDVQKRDINLFLPHDNNRYPYTFI